MRIPVSVVLAVAMLTIPQSAVAGDRDRDGLPDPWERKAGLSTAKKSAEGDPDRDLVDNRNELRQGTKPRVRDTDRDGRDDGREDRDRDGLPNAAEDLSGNDPRSRDSDEDGTPDGLEPAGVVVSFDGGLLTVGLARGGTVSGEVSEDTAVYCESEDSFEAGYAPLRGKKRRHRRGRRHGRRAGKSAHPGSRASQFEEDEDWPEDEEEDEDEDEDGDEDEDFDEDKDYDEDLDEDEDDEDEDHDEDHDEDEDEDLAYGNCSPDDLVPGARVRAGELDSWDGVVTFDEIELVGRPR